MQLATYQLALTANKSELGTDIVNGLASDGESSCGKHEWLLERGLLSPKRVARALPHMPVSCITPRRCALRTAYMRATR